tara:strand:+ start:380 stop:556 length:177 start_codon:yes stop_codon:yes gene_type:complete
MKVGELVKIIGYAVDVSEVGVVIELRPAERNGKRIIYRKVLMPDNSLIWAMPEDLEEL